MSPRYSPGPADAALTSQEGQNWTFVLSRELRQPPAKVWEALTDPAHLKNWAPFDASGNRSGPAFLNTERGLDKWKPASFMPPSRGAAVRST